MKQTQRSLSKPFRILLAAAFACATFTAYGCDMGTYNKRMQESNSATPKAAAVENETDSDDGESEDE